LAVGIWTLRTACTQAARWQHSDRGRSPLNVSVNLSARQLIESDLADQVAGILRDTGAQPDTIWLEITESSLAEDASVYTLQALRALGVHLVIDDFGTGYSSLSYLKRFPVEALKIDASFVDGLGNDPEDSAIVTACISLAHALNLTTVAEGVETSQQLAELRTLGCQQAQGEFFAAPQPADRFGDQPRLTLERWGQLTQTR